MRPERYNQPGAWPRFRRSYIVWSAPPLIQWPMVTHQPADRSRSHGFDSRRLNGSRVLPGALVRQRAKYYYTPTRWLAYRLPQPRVAISRLPARQLRPGCSIGGARSPRSSGRDYSVKFAPENQQSRERDVLHYQKATTSVAAAGQSVVGATGIDGQ